MAVTPTARLALNTWPLGTDPYRREQRNADAAALDLLVAIDRQGTLAARPAPGTRGTYYAPTDASVLGIIYRDDGGTWRTLGGTVDGLTSKPAAAVPGLKVQLAAGASADALDVRNSANAQLARISSAGAATVSGLTSNGDARVAGGGLTVNGTGATAGHTTELTAFSPSHRALTVRLAAGQTANALEVQNSAGTVLAYVTPSGGLVADGGAALKTTFIDATSAPTVALRVRGAASQTANLAEFQNSGGTVISRVYNDGSVGIGAAPSISLIADASGQTANGFLGKFDGQAAGTLVLRVRGAAGQTGNLAEFQGVNGTVTTSIAASGHIDTRAGIHAPSLVTAAATVASAYPFGMSIQYVVTGDGWPARGIVMTWRFETTAAVQYLIADDRTSVYTRTAPNQNLGAAWGAWRTI